MSAALPADCVVDGEAEVEAEPAGAAVDGAATLVAGADFVALAFFAVVLRTAVFFVLVFFAVVPVAPCAVVFFAALFLAVVPVVEPFEEPVDAGVAFVTLARWPLAVFAALDRPGAVFFTVDFLAADFFAVDFVVPAFFAVVAEVVVGVAVERWAVVFAALVFAALDFLAVEFFAVDFFVAVDGAAVVEVAFLAVVEDAFFADVGVVELLEPVVLLLAARFTAERCTGAFFTAGASAGSLTSGVARSTGDEESPVPPPTPGRLDSPKRSSWVISSARTVSRNSWRFAAAAASISSARALT